MAAVTPASSVAPLTYETYMAEPQVEGRYDIVEGVRVFMPGATWRHQRVGGNIFEALRHFERTSGLGMALSAPFDVLIRRTPRLQTRQPDVLFVSHARLAQGGIPDVGPLEAAPELVVEIVSGSETPRLLADKIADYIAIGVAECWVVRPDAHTIEVRPMSGNSQSGRIYAETETLASLAFPALTLPVADLLAS